MIKPARHPPLGIAESARRGEHTVQDGVVVEDVVITLLGHLKGRWMTISLLVDAPNLSLDRAAQAPSAGEVRGNMASRDG